MGPLARGTKSVRSRLTRPIRRVPEIFLARAASTPSRNCILAKRTRRAQPRNILPVGEPALGHKRSQCIVMSALPPKADMCGAKAEARYGSIADITIDPQRRGLQRRKGVAQRNV